MRIYENRYTYSLHAKESPIPCTLSHIMRMCRVRGEEKIRETLSCEVKFFLCVYIFYGEKYMAA